MTPTRERIASDPAVLAVAAAVFADSLLYSAVVPVLPGYADALGASPISIGVLFASYAVALMVVTPAVGAVSDRAGYRAPLVGGLLAVTGATVLFALASSYPWLLVARSLQGAAAAIVWSAGLALVADRVAPARAGASMGLVLSGMSAGLLLGPPAAGVLADAYGFRAPFLIVAALTAGVALLQLRLPRGIPLSTAPTPLGVLVRTGAFNRTMVAVAAAAAGLSLLEALLPLDLVHRFGATSTTIGLVFGAATLAHLLVSPAVGWFADRRPRLPLMAGGLVGMGAVIVFAGTAPTPAAVALVLVAVAVAYSFVLVPALPEIASVVHTTGSRGYAMAYGAFNIAYALGMVLGPTAGSAATAWRALPTVLIGTGLLLAVTGLLLQARLRRGLADAMSCCLRPGAEPRRQHHPTH